MSQFRGRIKNVSRANGSTLLVGGDTSWNYDQTWEIIVTPPYVKTIECKWVSKINIIPDGSIERYKAHLVGKRYSQVEGIDFLETFSPIVKMATMRVILTLASIHGWDL